MLKLKTPWRNGTTHIILTPMEFMQRLAALVPRPRLHLIRFHGVLAPNAKLRSKVVPTAAQQTTAGEGDCEHAHSQPLRMTWARLLKRVFDIDIDALGLESAAAASGQSAAGGGFVRGGLGLKRARFYRASRWFRLCEYGLKMIS